MPDSIEQKIITAIVTRLGTISTGNGFQTNIGAKVRDWETNWQEEDLPAISVFTGRAASDQAPTGRRFTQHLLPVTIVISLKRGTSAANARTAISDVKMAIRGGPTATGEIWERWPDNGAATGVGLAMWTREVAHSIQTPQDSLEIIGTQVEIDVAFITQKFNAEVQ